MSAAERNGHAPSTLEQCVQVNPEIELCYRVRYIGFTPAVNDIDSLLRVQVVKQQAVFRQSSLTRSRNA